MKQEKRILDALNSSLVAEFLDTGRYNDALKCALGSTLLEFKDINVFVNLLQEQGISLEEIFSKPRIERLLLDVYNRTFVDSIRTGTTNTCYTFNLVRDDDWDLLLSYVFRHVQGGFKPALVVLSELSGSAHMDLFFNILSNQVPVDSSLNKYATLELNVTSRLTATCSRPIYVVRQALTTWLENVWEEVVVSNTPIYDNMK